MTRSGRAIGMRPHNSRRTPARGVLRVAHQPTIVLVTVCTKNRSPWLATPQVHKTLTGIWKEATAWRAGRYVLMPDHLHLFCAPGSPSAAIEAWVQYWKSRFSRLHGVPEHRWQTGVFHHRLRHEERYLEKWRYVRDNPVRRRLVADADEWPYQGRVYDLQWCS